MADHIEVTITNFKRIRLLQRLQIPTKMNTLPNILPFLKLIRREASVCFTGPARCGKTTIIRNIHFALTATEVIETLGIEKWFSLLSGDLSITVLAGDSGVKTHLRYMPLIDSKDEYTNLVKTLGPSIIFHYRFKNVHSLVALKSVILEESMRVARLIGAIYKTKEGEFRDIHMQMQKRITACIPVIFESFPGMVKAEFRTYIFLDDYDVPLCDGSMVMTEFNAIKDMISNFVSYSSTCGYLCSLGSLSFPSKLLKMKDENVFTMKTKKLRFLGIPRSRAEAYLQAIGKPNINLKNSAGMLSALSHDIHPLCFLKSIEEPPSFFEIGVELKSYYAILEALRKSPETFKLVTTLYSNGWYPSANICEMYNDFQICDSYMENRIPISGCVAILESLGLIKKYKKTDNDDCLEEIGKSRTALPTSYYSFTNVIMYYSFTFFMQKIFRDEKTELSSAPFLVADLESIIKMCEEFLERHSGFRLKENAFVDKIFYDLIQLFPKYLPVLRFMVDDENAYNLDLGLFSFNQSAASYVWEFKKAEDIMSMVAKDHEAIHQIYCRKYFNFIRRIDSTMTEVKFKDRLKNMYFITYVTDTTRFANIIIRKYNNKLLCDCTTPGKPCMEAKTYSYLKQHYYQLPSNMPVGYANMERILPPLKRTIYELDEDYEEYSGDT